MAAVGFDTYCRILAEQVSEMKGEPPEEEPDLRIDLPVRAFLPVGYVGEERLRLDLYRRISSARTEEELRSVEEEMADRFGAIPQEAATLLDQGRLRVACRARGIAEVSTFRGQVRLRPVEAQSDALPAGASYHPATRTLNLAPGPSQMGPGLPAWIRSRLEASVPAPAR